MAENDRDRWIDAISRMIELTQSGELRWRVGQGSAPELGEPITPPYYAEYGDKTFRLQSHLHKMEFWENVALPRRRRDEEMVTLELVNAEGRRLYRVPQVGPLRDLLREAQRQSADPDAVLDDLLGNQNG